MKLGDIKKYWEKTGKEFPLKGKVTPTSKDFYLGKLEEESILDHLDKRHIALELGCGDASHAISYAKKVKRLSCIDVSESLINIAKERVLSRHIRNVDFVIGSVLDIEKIYRLQRFDCVISQRLLINLPKWQDQRDVIRQVYKLLKRGGLFLLTEGFKQEYDNLGEIREKCGLTRPKIVCHNRYIMRRDFEAFVSKYFDIISVRSYGIYLFLSRLYYPLVISPEEPQYESRFNEVAMRVSRMVQMPDLERYGYHRFYALLKR